MEATTPKRLPPPEPVRLMMTAFMAFIKGAVVSAIVIAPFLGIWAAVGTSLAFTSFCVWLAHKKGPGVGLVERKKPADTKNPEVQE
ncbi:hypothetical protein [Profundibacter amoris]|uniref:Uncharacterized protein n=1 Tax=Profundibacter amoris TaxID=2171755 RepID=A0A347UGX5_9RHOB|nr:hypothetical protein [Profundibacter amoris]AXX98103.1 hypothetical protein BAR1_09260 [Profundibacter amoris]